jgi:hypothetical protein
MPPAYFLLPTYPGNPPSMPAWRPYYYFLLFDTTFSHTYKEQVPINVPMSARRLPYFVRWAEMLGVPTGTGALCTC